MKEGVTGVTSRTPQHIMFGAGTIHRGLKYAEGAWNFSASLVGATSGGSKLDIVPEIKKVEVDGAWVSVKGLNRKTGGKATMEINFVEATPDVLQAATLGKEGVSDATGMKVLEDKPDIVDGDYWENVAYVGKELDGENIIAILDNALCTSGLPMESKDKDSAVFKLMFECNADLAAEDLTTLPWHIYYPDREGA